MALREPGALTRDTGALSQSQLRLLRCLQNGRPPSSRGPDGCVQGHEGEGQSVGFRQAESTCVSAVAQYVWAECDAQKRFQTTSSGADICLPTFRAALSTVRRGSSQGCIGGGMDTQTWCMFHTSVEYYSALKREGRLTHAKTWKNLEDTTLSEISRHRGQTWYDSTYEK